MTPLPPIKPLDWQQVEAQNPAEYEAFEAEGIFGTYRIVHRLEDDDWMLCGAAACRPHKDVSDKKAALMTAATEDHVGRIRGAFDHSRIDPSMTEQEAISKIRQQLDVNLSYFVRHNERETLAILQTHIEDQLKELDRALAARLTPYAALEDATLAEVPPHDGEWIVYARSVAQSTGVPLDVTKAILRQLRDKGLIRLTVAFDEDEGSPRGSGYIRTTPAKGG